MTEAEFREALAHFVTGVTVVTAAGPAGPHGVTVNAFASVSLEPPLVLVCIERQPSVAHHPRTQPAFRGQRAGGGAGSALALLCGRGAARGARCVSRDPVPAGRTGAPLLDGCVAYVECRVTASHPGGDHTIFVGAVERAWAVPERRPLVYYHRAYRDAREP